MTAYESGLPVEVAFGPEEARSLAQAFSEAGWTQFHVAETEKYAHVTYFFNGGREAAWPGEERRLVPSPRVATYDLQPEMSAAGVTDELVAAIESGRYDFIVANYANPDMVGHTGVGTRRSPRSRRSTAASAASPTPSERVEAADPAGPGAALLITADHGNADELRDAAGQPVTAHSLNPVPAAGRSGRALAGRRLRDGVLADVAPTILELAGLPRWEGMTGRSLLDVGAARGRGPRFCYHPDRHHPEVNPPVNPILAIGQILLSIALIAAILLQARGTGLSGTFGGDSAVYRSRRGIERRLWQFTIVLLVLFVAVRLVSFVYVYGAGSSSRPAFPNNSMSITRRDHAVVAVLVAVPRRPRRRHRPAARRHRRRRPSRRPSPRCRRPTTYREGVVGVPERDHAGRRPHAVGADPRRADLQRPRPPRPRQHLRARPREVVDDRRHAARPGRSRSATTPRGRTASR